MPGSGYTPPIHFTNVDWTLDCNLNEFQLTSSYQNAQRVKGSIRSIVKHSRYQVPTDKEVHRSRKSMRKRVTLEEKGRPEGTMAPSAKKRTAEDLESDLPLKTEEHDEHDGPARPTKWLKTERA
ncbi:hypothetical protein C8J57DRAFT_1238434 [Mycena rebaudengoi]|nr:hypothetical protein C8J57DRAFT_1238434 [Mycena rebaudengoi]